MESLSFTHVKGSNETANTIDSLTNLLRDLKGKWGGGWGGEGKGRRRREGKIHKGRDLRNRFTERQ
jgi:hypothetical protein